MPTYGAHTFLWIDERTTQKGNKAIAATAEAGFDFIEISLLRPDEFDVAAHKKALTEAGIEATGSLVLPEWAHMPQEPEKAKQFLSSALEKLEAVGATYLGGCIAFALGKFTGDRQVVIDTLGEVAVDANYKGPMVVKSFPAVNPNLAAAIKLWRPPTQSSAFLAREGLKFLKEHAEKYGLGR